MREILFRGKTKDGGEWVEGSLHIEVGETDKNGNQKLDYRILGLRGECDYIIPETVGQFTGLTDKNGKKIFEGDIVRSTVSYNTLRQDKVDDITAIYEVKYHEKHCYFYLARKNNNLIFDGNWSYYLKKIEVIGNIHDNPKMWEEVNGNA